MVTEEFYTTDAYGNNLYGNCWKPEGEAKVVITILHGQSDHIGRFEHFAEEMVQKDIAVMGIDMQGHGRSPGKRGHFRSFQQLMSNVEVLLREARLRFNDTPMILYGQSLGGNLAANFALLHQSKELSGLILSSPFFELAFNPPKLKIVAANILEKIMPSLSFDNELDPMELSHNPVIGFKYLEDPLVHRKISVNAYFISKKAAEKALESAHLLKYPTLILHGDEDRLTSHKGSEKFAKSAGKYVDLKIWEGMRHELHNENEKEDVVEYIYTWIIKTIGE